MGAKISDQLGAFTTIPNDFVDRSHELSDQARWFFVLLRRYTNGESGKAFPSYKKIQQQTGWTPKTIAKAARDLEAAGWLTREKQFGGVTLYTLRNPQYVPTGSAQTTSPREVQYVPTGSPVRPYGKSNKIETKKTETKKTFTDEDAGLIAEIYAEVSQRQLSIREQEYVNARVSNAEAEAFRHWLTGWAASYGTKSVFNTLEAYERYRAKQRAGLAHVGNLEAVPGLLGDSQRPTAPAVDRRNGDPGVARVAVDTQGSRPQQDFFARQAAKSRAR